LNFPMQKIVEGISHLRIRQFIDDEEQAAKLIPLIQAKPLYQVTVKDRKGQPTLLTLNLMDGKNWATLSSRPGNVFELFPETLRLFELAEQR